MDPETGRSRQGAVSQIESSFGSIGEGGCSCPMAPVRYRLAVLSVCAVWFMVKCPSETTSQPAHRA